MKQTAADEAVRIFNEGYNCSQAVLAVFAERLGMPRDMALKAACGFGGGVGAGGHVCGALSGAVMALGLKFAAAEPNRTAKQEVYNKVRLLCDEFKLRTGSLYCRDLLDFDMGTDEGRLLAARPGAFDRCDDFVRIATELVEEFIEK